MNRSAFDPDFAGLPETLAIFPLPGAIVLPGQVLPLNIFEPRYLNMVLDALGEHRMIGMIQPAGDQRVEPISVHAVGCGARITAFQESPDGQLLINLTGVCRFVVGEELALHRGYRRIQANWSTYRADLEAPPAVNFDLSAMEPALRAFFAARRLEPSWKALRAFDAASLIDFLAMTLPFDPPTKQVLVEAIDTNSRGKLIMTALSEALLDTSGESAKH